MKDIAAQLNITVDAVSKALRDSPAISEATKAKVRAKAKELGYVKNILAASVKSGRSKNVAIFINDLYNPYFSIMSNKILKELDAQGYVGILSLSNGYYLEEKDTMTVFANKCPLAISLVEPSKDVVNLFVSNKIPLFLIGIKPKEEEINYAITDDFDGGYKVGKYFALNSFKKAIFVTNSPSETSTRRYSGFIKAISEGPEIKPYSFVPYDIKGDIIKTAARSIQNENIDFAFCYSDYVGYALRTELHKQHFKGKVTIFGYDNTSEFMTCFDSLNSVATDVNALVKDVVTNAIKSLDDGRMMKKTYPVQLVLQTEWIFSQ